MQLIKPVVITDALLASSSVPEPDTGESVWAGGTTYALGAPVIRTQTHRVYESLQASNIGHTPESSPTWWSDVGPTNRWAMFDGETSTASSAASTLTVTLSPGAIAGLAALAMVGNSLSVVMTDGGATVYSGTIALVDGTPVSSWWEYFFTPIAQRRDVVLTDLPSIGTATITVTLTGAGTVSMGVLAVGALRELYGLMYGATIGILDFSKKITDAATGKTSLEKKAFSKRLIGKTQVPSGALDAVVALLQDVRATPIVWIGDADNATEALIIFGFYRDFSVDLAFPGLYFCSLTIEGLA